MFSRSVKICRRENLLCKFSVQCIFSNFRKYNFLKFEKYIKSNQKRYLIDLNLFEPIINSLDHTIHKSNLKEFFIDDFIHDLQRYMLRQNFDYDYSKLPKSIIFEIDYIEDGFTSCLDTSQKHSEKYCIPSGLLDESAKKADYIQFDVLNILQFLILTKKILTNFNKK